MNNDQKKTPEKYGNSHYEGGVFGSRDTGVGSRSNEGELFCFLTFFFYFEVLGDQGPKTCFKNNQKLAQIHIWAPPGGPRVIFFLPKNF